MKHLKSLFAIIVFTTAFTFTAKAHGGDNDKSLTKKIRSVLSTPKCLKNNTTTEKVTVYFTVNQAGDVIDANAKTTNPEIKAHLEKQFLSLNLEGLTPCVTNTVDVSFTSK